MDAVFFAVKQAHLAAGRVGRRLLEGMGLTPARFDLLVAIGSAPGPMQSEVRKMLGVARSTLSELVSAIEGLGWVRREPSQDRRTRNLVLTRRGKALLLWAYRRFINRGLVPLAIDAALASGDPETDVEQGRFELVGACVTLWRAFGRDPPRDLYLWHPEDYLDAFASADLSDEPTGGVPFVQ